MIQRAVPTNQQVDTSLRSIHRGVQQYQRIGLVAVHGMLVLLGIDLGNAPVPPANLPAIIASLVVFGAVSLALSLRGTAQQGYAWWPFAAILLSSVPLIATGGFIGMPALTVLVADAVVLLPVWGTVSVVVSAFGLVAARSVFAADAWEAGRMIVLIGALAACGVALAPLRLVRDSAYGMVADSIDRAVQHERTRLSRSVHDILGSTLTAIAVKASLAEKLLGDSNPQAAQEIREVADLARGSIEEARRASYGIAEITLEGELDRASVIMSSVGINVVITGTPHPRLSKPREELFAIIVREAVTNVLRHSKSTTCRINIDEAGIEVHNDGVLKVRGSDRSTLGLVGLRQGVMEAGGVLIAERGDNAEFRLIATFPPSRRGIA